MTSISWKKPVLLAHANLATTDVTDRLLDLPGIYFFSRRFGDGEYQPFYIGRTKHVRTRLCQYISGCRKHETRVRHVIEGGRDPHSGVTARAERALIQFGLIVDWGLINNHHAGHAATRRFAMNGTRYSYLLPRTLITQK